MSVLKFIKQLRKSHRVKYGLGNNQLILHKPNGNVVVNPRRTQNYTVRFYGENATMEIYEPCYLDGSRFMLYNSDKFTIKQNVAAAIQVMGSAECVNGAAVLYTDENCTLNNTAFYLNSCPDTFIKLGKDCMFSFDVSVWASDTHQIIDTKSNCIINNNKKGVVFGDHVWCGTRCTILKGTRVADNSVIGAQSLVSGNFEQPNVILAGNPAKQIKQDITWKRAALPAD